MKLYWLLLKTQIKLVFRRAVPDGENNQLGKKSRIAKRTLALVGMTVAILAAASVYIFMAFSIVGAAVSIGISEQLFSIVLLAGMFVVLIFGTIYSINSLYNSKDAPFIATLPVPERTAFAVRFTQVYLGELIVFAALAMSVFIMYGIITGASAMFYVAAVIITILGPALPVTIGAFISMFIARAAAKSRRKDLIMTIGTFVLIIVIVGLNSFISNQFSSVSEGAAQTILNNYNVQINNVASIFPPAEWGAKFLTGGAAIYFVYYIILAVVVIALAVVLIGKNFYKFALLQSEGSAQSKQFKNVIKASSMVKSVIVKEWRIILRTPAYASNCLMNVFMGPLIVLIMIYGSRGSNELLQLANSGSGGIIQTLSIACFLLFFGNMQSAASTMYTREGNCFWMTKTLPVEAFELAKAKFLCSVSISLLSMVTTTITFALVMDTHPVMMFISFIFGLIGSFAGNAFGIAMDIRKPKLQWETEQKAVKNNMNATKSIFLNMLFAIVFGGISAGLYFLVKIDYAILLILLVLLILLAFWGYARIRNAVKAVS